MELFMHPGACSLSPHIVARELELPIRLIEVDRKTHTTADGEDFHHVNGNGYVPVLRLQDGRSLSEGPAIVQFLADLRPDAGLLPEPGSMERSQVQSWLNFITSELHKPMGMLFSPAYSPARQALLELIGKRLKWVSSRAAGPFLTGNDFTVADAYLFVCLNWSPWIGVDLDRWPVLGAFMRTVAMRPKVREALEAEGLDRYGANGIFFAPRQDASSSVREVRP